MSAQEIIAELARLNSDELRLVNDKLKQLRTSENNRTLSLQPADCSAAPVHPFTERESEEAFSPDPEWEAMAASMARLPLSIPHN